MLELSQYCEYRQEKACSSLATMDNYVSTENMLPNKAGISKASSIPSTGKLAVRRRQEVVQIRRQKVAQTPFQGV